MLAKPLAPRQMRESVGGLVLGINEPVLTGGAGKDASGIAAGTLDIAFRHQPHHDQHMLQRIVRQFCRPLDDVVPHRGLFDDLPLDPGPREAFGQDARQLYRTSLDMRYSGMRR